MESSSSFSLPNDDKSSYDNLDLPFLITHWLTRYSGGNVGGSSGDHTSTKRNNNFNIADPAPMPSAAASNDVGGEGRELLRLTQRQSKIFEGINEENVNANISDTIAKHEPQKQIAEAMDRIRRATSELACAFSDLGAFGSTIAVSAVRVLKNIYMNVHLRELLLLGISILCLYLQLNVFVNGNSFGK